jgi:hypothetical protein
MERREIAEIAGETNLRVIEEVYRNYQETGKDSNAHQLRLQKLRLSCDMTAHNITSKRGLKNLSAYSFRHGLYPSIKDNVKYPSASQVVEEINNTPEEKIRELVEKWGKVQMYISETYHEKEEENPIHGQIRHAFAYGTRTLGDLLKLSKYEYLYRGKQKQ